MPGMSDGIAPVHHGRAWWPWAGLLFVAVLALAGIHAWLSYCDDTPPAIVLGEIPGQGFVLTFTGLPKGADWQLRVDGNKQSLALQPEAHAPQVSGAARFNLPHALAGQTVRVSIGSRFGAALAENELELPKLAALQDGQTLYLGSCLYNPARLVGEPILDALLQDARGQPAPAMLWLGDNVYYGSSDWKSEEAMALAYKAERGNGSLRRLLRAIPQYAIWDDHDYGPDNADGSFAQREVSQRVFRAHWTNPRASATDGGHYASVRRGNVEIFLTDNRSYRKPLGANRKASAMLGGPQIQWLKSALLQSTAPVKLIVGGSQWLADHPTEEGWQHYPSERSAFLDWLANASIPGVLFISGDRHHSTLFERTHLGRTLTELTCSALTSVPESVGRRGYENVRLLGETEKNNYCRLSVSPNAEVTIAVIDAEGRPLLNQAIAAHAARRAR